MNTHLAVSTPVFVSSGQVLTQSPVSRQSFMWCAGTAPRVPRCVAVRACLAAQHGGAASAARLAAQWEHVVAASLPGSGAASRAALDALALQRMFHSTDLSAAWLCGVGSLAVWCRQLGCVVLAVWCRQLGCVVLAVWCRQLGCVVLAVWCRQLGCVVLAVWCRQLGCVVLAVWCRQLGCVVSAAWLCGVGSLAVWCWLCGVGSLAVWCWLCGVGSLAVWCWLCGVGSLAVWCWLCGVGSLAVWCWLCGVGSLAVWCRQLGCVVLAAWLCGVGCVVSAAWLCGVGSLAVWCSPARLKSVFGIVLNAHSQCLCLLQDLNGRHGPRCVYCETQMSHHGPRFVSECKWGWVICCVSILLSHESARSWSPSRNPKQFAGPS